LELELELLLELEFELEFELLLLLELELLLLLWFELLLELEFELLLLLWLELELELLLLLWFELELLLWFELLLLRRLIVRRFSTARARHHSIVFPSICRSTGSLRRLIVRRFSTARARHHSIVFPSICRSAGTGLDAALSETGATATRPSSDRDVRGSRAAPTARPKAPSAPAYAARIFLFRNAIATCPLLAEGVEWRSEIRARRASRFS
jgi:hypothetical protein